MNKNELLSIFAAPGAEYRGKPFWSWNGELRKEELARQVGAMKKMGLGGYFMHSRAGLITEYLGDEWFDLINATADEGEKVGMEAWLYDEDRWPSGSAGGKVTVDPQYRMKSLTIFQIPAEKYEEKDNTFALFVAALDGLTLYDYAKVEDGDVNGAFAKIDCTKGNKYVLRFEIIPDRPSSNYNGTTYIDTMSYKAVYKFIEMTHEEYYKHCGDRLGRSIKGIFTDEPHRGKCMSNKAEHDGIISCGICYTEDIFEQFEVRYGYDALAILPELFYFYKGKKYNRVKLNYIDLADNLFVERFAIPINDWCRAHNIEFTGHVLHEDTLMCQTSPHGSLMRFYQYMGIPGVDVLSEYNSNPRIVKQLASSARQCGKKNMLSELYGCTGWQMNFKSHKAVGDWQALYGINLRCQHLSWYTMEGESKRDYPASILHQSPWYKDYNYVESYFARFNALMTEGKPVCDTLVINPIESVWAGAYLGWCSWIFSCSDYVNDLDNKYSTLSDWLLGNHIDYDYGEEQMMRDMAEVTTDCNGNAVLRVGKAFYHTVIVGGMTTIRPTTLDLLRRFARAGGKVIFAGDVPACVDAVESNEPSVLADECIKVAFEEDAIVNCVKSNITVRAADGSNLSTVITQSRKYDNCTVFALVNEDRHNGFDGITITLDAEKCDHVQRLICEDGKRYSLDSIADYADGKITLKLDIEAAGSIFLLVTADNDNLDEMKDADILSVNTLSEGEFTYKLDEENVCVLDYCRWKWDDKGDWHDECEVLKADNHIRDDIGIEHRGGEMLQPWFAKLNCKEKYGNLTLEYRFNADTIPDGDVYLAGERPEFNDYYINGEKLTPCGIDSFYVDDCLKRMAVPAGLIKLGENVVTVKTNFMRTTNIEALYLTGNFGVKYNGHRNTLTTLPEKLGLGDLQQYNLPFYTGAITYTIPNGSFGNAGNGERVIISPKSFTGSLCKVKCGDKNIVMAWEPYEADITDEVNAGHDIEFTYVGTRRNTFGPLHLLPELQGSYGPDHFRTSGDSWSDDYKLIASGVDGIVVKIVK